jgi:hypothetical protein
VPGDLELASLPRRLAASVINLISGLGMTLGLLALVGLPAWPFRSRLRRWWRRWAPSSWPVPLGPAMLAQSTVMAARSRNRRGRGSRLLRVRRVDVRTGGPVSVRAALTAHLIGVAQAELWRRVIRAHQREGTARLDALRPELERIRREHADDSERRQQVLMDFYRDRGVNPLRSCGPDLLPHLATTATVVLSRRHQSLADRVAGIVTIVDPP